MKYLKIALFCLACVPLLALVLVALTCGPALAAPDVRERYCVASNNAQTRVLIRTCISSGRCHQSSIASVRLSADGTQGIIKWTPQQNETAPASVLLVCLQNLSHAEAWALMRTPEWTVP